jgi:FtsH-binding integral membrane protein
MFDFVLGFFVGGTLVGCSIERTICAARGKILTTVLLSSVNSALYFFSIAFIAKENHAAYLGTCIGSTVAVSLIAYKNKKRNEGKCRLTGRKK